MSYGRLSSALLLAALGCGGGVRGAATAAASAPDDLDKLTDEQLARRLMELTGAAKLGTQVGTAMARGHEHLGPRCATS